MLLRLLQDGNFERLGGSEVIKVDVRIIAATNQDLPQAIEDGKFRTDLFYRLNVFPITIPPLRQRPEDIPDLVWKFAQELGPKMGKQIERVSKRSMEKLQRYNWPGNIRELRNTIERAIIQCRGRVLQIDTPPKSAAAATSGMATIAEVEKQHILATLDRVGWKIRGEGGAAEQLGLPPTTLESRLKKHGISRPGA
ncbi:MAG: sigma 54-interacting transcriptional regulator [Verrucomicrobiota bacterium]